MALRFLIGYMRNEITHRKFTQLGKSLFKKIQIGN